MPQKRKKAARSLTTLFDKNALHQLSSQTETTNERMKRFFTSITPTYKDSKFSAKKAKVSRENASQDVSSKFNQSDESGIDPFVFDSPNQVEDITLDESNVKDAESPSEKSEGYKKSITASLQKQFSHISSSNESVNDSRKSSPHRKQDASNDVVDRISTPHMSKTIFQLNRKSPMQDPSRSNNTDGVENVTCSKTIEPTNETQDSGEKSQLGTVKKSTHRRSLSSKFAISDTNCEEHLNRCKFLRTQMSILKDPVMFGGIVKYKFESRRADLQHNEPHLPETLIDSVIKRYNKKLLRYHHDHDEDSKMLQSQAMSCLNQISELRDDVTLEKYWESAASNCAFKCPDEIPPSFKATREQHAKYHKLKSEIEKLQDMRSKKLDVMTNFEKMLKQLDLLKNTTAKFVREQSTCPAFARQYASKLNTTLNDVQVMKTSLSKFLEEEDSRLSDQH